MTSVLPLRHGTNQGIIKKIMTARGRSSAVLLLTVTCVVACNCNVYGSVRDDCDQTTGSCVCKRHVTGLKCDRCVNNGRRLRPYGCSSKWDDIHARCVRIFSLFYWLTALRHATCWCHIRELPLSTDPFCSAKLCIARPMQPSCVFVRPSRCVLYRSEITYPQIFSPSGRTLWQYSDGIPPTRASKAQGMV